MAIEKEDIERLRKSFCFVHAQASRASKKIGYNFNLMWFLYALDGNNPKSQKQICAEWGMTKTTLNTVVKECEKKGYILFETIEGEKREKNIVLTDIGKAYMQQAIDKMAKIEENALLKLGDYQEFLCVLEKFCENFKSEIDKIC